MSNHHNVLFVTEKFIKENTPIQSNVEYTNLRPVIRYVQDSKLQLSLGTKLYRELQRQVGDNDIKTDYQLLLDDYIVHILAHGFMSEAPVDMLIKYMNLTVGTSSGDNIQPVSLNQVKYLQEQHKGRSEFYLQRMVDYLCFNTDKYPEYLEGIEDDIRPRRKAYTGNIYTSRFPESKISKEVKYDGAVYDIKNGRWNYDK